MNKTIKKFLLTEDKFMAEMHSRQPGFTYTGCAPFSKIFLKKFKETGDSKYIYQNELDKACFQHDMAYGDFKDLLRRIAADKVLRDKAFNIAKNPKYHRYPRGLVSLVSKFFDKMSTSLKDKSACSSGVKSEIIPNQELALEFHKPIIRKLEKRKV